MATGKRQGRSRRAVRRMAVDRAVLLVGAMAIQACRSMNGFVSEWLTFQALISGCATPDVAVEFPLSGSILALESDRRSCS